MEYSLTCTYICMNKCLESDVALTVPSVRIVTHLLTSESSLIGAVICPPGSTMSDMFHTFILSPAVLCHRR